MLIVAARAFLTKLVFSVCVSVIIAHNKLNREPPLDYFEPPKLLVLRKRGVTLR